MEIIHTKLTTGVNDCLSLYCMWCSDKLAHPQGSTILCPVNAGTVPSLTFNRIQL